MVEEQIGEETDQPHQRDRHERAQRADAERDGRNEDQARTRREVAFLRHAARRLTLTTTTREVAMRWRWGRWTGPDAANVAVVASWRSCIRIGANIYTRRRRKPRRARPSAAPAARAASTRAC